MIPCPRCADLDARVKASYKWLVSLEGGPTDLHECLDAQQLMHDLAALLQEKDEKEAALHDLITSLWVITDPETAPFGLQDRVEEVLGMGDPDGHCGNHICQQICDFEEAVREKDEALTALGKVKDDALDALNKMRMADTSWDAGHAAGYRSAEHNYKALLAQRTEALRTYGQHLKHCPRYTLPVGSFVHAPCICGWDAALTGDTEA